MKSYTFKLLVCSCLQLLLSLLGISLSYLNGTPKAVGVIYGLLSIGVVLATCIWIYTQIGFQKSLLCINGALLAPIWFLFLEGLIPNDETAYILPTEERIGGYAYSLLYLSIFVGVYALMLNMLKKISKRTNGPISYINLNSTYLSVATLALFFIPLIIIGSRYDNLGELWRALTAGRTDGESGTLLRISGAGGGAEALLMPLTWLWQLTPGLAAVSIVLSFQRKGQGVALAICAGLAGIAVAFFTFLGGARGIFIFVIAIPLMLWIYYGFNLGLKFWITSIIGFFLLIGLMEFQVRTRGNMLSYITSSGVTSKSADGEATTFNPLRSHRDNNLYFVCLIVKNIPNKYPYEGFSELFALLANPIPRVFWPNKPILAGAKSLKEAKDVYVDGPLTVGTASITTSVVGQSYQWAGIFGFIVLSSIYAVFSAWFDSWFLKTKKPGIPQVALQGFSAFMMLWGFRDLGAIMFFVFPYIIFYFSLIAIGLVKKFSVA